NNPDEIKEQFIGVRGKGKERIEHYNNDMEKCIAEMHRVLKPNKSCVVVVGNAFYQGREINTVATLTEMAERAGFETYRSVHKIIFGLYNVMQKEKILFFRKR
ncbi:MAG: hypothetical protein DRI77_13000, partial [Chloroflexi bacterium]